MMLAANRSALRSAVAAAPCRGPQLLPGAGRPRSLMVRRFKVR
jgi:hypothetical protein